MTYKEVLDWIEESYDIDSYDDLGELYDQILEDWEGRGSFDDIMSIDDFINEFEWSEA